VQRAARALEFQDESLVLVGFVDLTRPMLGSSGFRELCRARGLPARVWGYGFVLCEDEVGRRFSLATSDLALFQGLLDSCETFRSDAFPYRIDGWPLEWVAGVCDGGRP